MLQLNVTIEAILCLEIVEILVDLRRARIRGGPVCLGLERPCVAVCRNIAGTARVAILEPGSAGLGILFVYGQREVVKVALDFVGQEQARCASADTNDPQIALGLKDGCLL